MADELDNKLGAAAASKPASVSAVSAVAEEVDTEHYEEVAEYRIGEGAPPIALVVMFVLIVAWATLSWIPFSDTSS